MGRKRIPKNQRREVISLSLKPTTIDLIDSLISQSTSRSVFVENLLLKALDSVQIDQSKVKVTRAFWDCHTCEKGYSKVTGNRDDILCKSCMKFIPLSHVEEESI